MAEIPGSERIPGEAPDGACHPSSEASASIVVRPVEALPGRHISGASDFRPPWWLGSGHLQTLAPSLFGPSARVALVHERVELPDGDFMDLHWLGRARPGPVLILLPGMQGSEDSACVRSLLLEVDRLGGRAVVLCHRGAHVANRLPGSYHAGFTDHLARLVERLQRRLPDAALHAVGFSLGGSILIRYLAEAGAASGLTSCAAVSLTFELSSTARRACEGFNRVYQWRVLRSYLRASHLKAHLPALAARLPALARVRTIRDFDGVITAPLHGFTDAEDYYRQCSSRQFLGSVRTPLLILNAADDPLVAPDTLPPPASLNACVRLELTGRGGHLGFLGRSEGTWQPFVPARLLPFVLEGSGS